MNDDADAMLRTFRAAVLVSDRGTGTAPGPVDSTDIDLIATRFYLRGVDLIAALQNDDADALAQQLGWQSATDLMAFLSDGPETARVSQ